MISLLFFVTYIQVGYSDRYNYAYNNLKKFSPEHVCNYEPDYVTNVAYGLYYCMEKSKCPGRPWTQGHPGIWSIDREKRLGRDPVLKWDPCPETFENGEKYICCNPADVPHWDDSNTNKTLGKPTKWAKGVRATIKCNDFSGLTCLNRKHCPTTKRRYYDKGAKRVELTKYPHLAMIGRRDKFLREGDIWHALWFCLGTVISKWYVLTSASCREDEDGWTATDVNLGEDILCADWDFCKQLSRDQFQTIQIEKMIPHPKSNVAYYFHDLMLLKLKEEIKFNQWTRPACLETGAYTQTPTMTLDYGKGLFATYQEMIVAINPFKYQNSTHEMQIPIETDNNCKDFFINDRRLGENPWDPAIMMCAGDSSSNPAVVPCKNDFGGPLQTMNYHPDCMWIVIGVMTHSTSFWCRASKPPVFTRVSWYIQWIEDTVWPDFDIYTEVDTTSFLCEMAPPSISPRPKIPELGRC